MKGFERVENRNLRFFGFGVINAPSIPDVHVTDATAVVSGIRNNRTIYATKGRHNNIFPQMASSIKDSDIIYEELRETQFLIFVKTFLNLGNRKLRTIRNLRYEKLAPGFFLSRILFRKSPRCCKVFAIWTYME